jgi:hypothetical protein
MNAVLEYVTDLSREHIDAWQCMGAVIIFALLVIAARQWRGP